jgi:type 1 glutamine amidotransferase
MKSFSHIAAILCLGTVALFTPVSSASAADAPAKPLRALLILGGCCHDYANQKDILKAGIEKRAHVQVDVVHNPDKSTKARFEIYEKADWAKGYDVIIHDECSADVKDLPYVQNVLAAHQNGVPAVNLHCAMHSYRTGTDDWFKFIGIQSSSHGPQKPIAIHFVDKEHAVTRGLSDWTTIDEELYNNIKLFDTAKPLARGKQIVKQRDGTEKEVEAVVVWTNEYGNGKTRIFNTTIGHNNATVGDDRYLDLVTRGLLWACGKLDESHLKAAPKKAN